MKPVVAAGLVGFGGQSISGMAYAAISGVSRLGPAQLTFSDHDGFKAFKGGICVNTLLDQDEKSLLNKSNVNSDEWQNKKDKFKSPRGNAKGCLAVSWNKRIWSNGHWKGEIKWEWLYSIGNESIVTYGLWTSEYENSNVWWRTIYINKQTRVSSWKLWNIPKEQMPKNPYFLYWEKEHWGFNPDFKKICSSSNCQGDYWWRPQREYKWTWEAEESGRDRFSDWTSNSWDSFLSFSWMEGNYLNEFENLLKEEGTWTQR